MPNEVEEIENMISLLSLRIGGKVTSLRKLARGVMHDLKFFFYTAAILVILLTFWSRWRTASVKVR